MTAAAQSGFTVDEIVSKYINIRDQIATIEGECKKSVAGLKEQQEVIEAWLLNKANNEGVDSFATKHGTAFVKVSDYCGVQDWDAVLHFIQNNQAWNMLNHAVNKTAVKEFIEKNQVPPPGVNYGAKKEIQIRRKS